jgi:RNA polymerase sigma factor (sigma-70 family)
VNYNALVEQNYSKIHSIAKSKASKYYFIEADDLCQESLLRAMEYFENFSPEKGSFINWVSNIMDNLIKDLIKEERKKKNALQNYRNN